MVNLLTNIINERNIPRIVRWEVADPQVYARQTPAYFTARIYTYGPGGELYRDHTIVVFDGAAASTCLRKNPAPQNFGGLFETFTQVLAPGAFATVEAAWNGNTLGGTRRAREEAVERALLAVGALSPDFAGA